MATTMRIPTEFTAIDKFSSVVSRMTGSVDKFSNTSVAAIDRFNQKANKIAGNMAIAGGAIVGGFGLAINSASGFEKSMSNVSTLVDTSTEDMDKMGKEVLKLSKTLPVPIEELTSSLYDIRSAGIPAKDAMSALETSAKLAKAGLSTTSEATNILTSAMNAFASEGLSSDEIANLLFKTVKAGKTNMADLSQAFGANAAVIQSAGVKLADFQAATAALTVTGAPASQAQNQIKASIVALQKPTAEMTKIFKRLGVTSEKELIAKEGGLVGAFDAVNKAGQSMGINLAKAWSSVEASSAVTGLLGANNEAYVATLSDMQSGTDALTGAFAKQLDTTASRTQLAKNNMEALSITIGTQVAPILSTLIDVITPIITGVTEWINKNPKLTKTIALVGIGLLALSGIIKGTTMALSVGQTVIAAYSAVMAWYSGVAVTAALTGASFAAVIWATVWPVLAVIAAIGAIIAIFYYLDEIVAWFGKQWEAFTSWIGELWNNVVKWFQEFDFMNFFKQIGQSIINFMLWPLKTVLGLVAKLPGTVGDAAQSALDTINDLTDLGVKAEVLPSPEQKQTENMQNIGVNGNIGININDKNNNVGNVTSDFGGGGIMPKVTKTQGGF